MTAGSRLKIQGRRLSSVTTVVFHGAGGSADDASVGVESSSERTIRLTVPPEARSGPVSAWVGGGAHSAPSRTLVVRDKAKPKPPAGSPPATSPSGEERSGSDRPASVSTSLGARRMFFGARRRIEFLYRVKGDQPVQVTVTLVRLADRRVVRTWVDRAAHPGRLNRIVWSGAAGRSAAPSGRYAFRLSAQGRDGIRLSTSGSRKNPSASFTLEDHVFPIRGPHNYGGGGSRFGAGRSGHSHQGQDVFARCGTRLVAARGGVVKWNRYHSAAGHYLVIDGAGTGNDYVYMHLTGPAPVRQGQRVYTGQPIGTVGESGNAAGCHLHFELWTAPGWYDGGRPFDPYPSLRDWDRGS